MFASDNCVYVKHKAGPYPRFYFNRGKKLPTPYFLFLSLSPLLILLFPFPIPLFCPSSPPFLLPSLSVPSHFFFLLPLSLIPFPEAHSLKLAREPEERCKFPQRVKAEPGRQMVSDAYWAEKSASGDRPNNYYEVFRETSCRSPRLKLMQRN